MSDIVDQEQGLESSAPDELENELIENEDVEGQPDGENESSEAPESTASEGEGQDILQRKRPKLRNQRLKRQVDQLRDQVAQLTQQITQSQQVQNPAQQQQIPEAMQIDPRQAQQEAQSRAKIDSFNSDLQDLAQENPRFGQWVNGEKMVDSLDPDAINALILKGFQPEDFYNIERNKQSDLRNLLFLSPQQQVLLMGQLKRELVQQTNQPTSQKKASAQRLAQSPEPTGYVEGEPQTGKVPSVDDLVKLKLDKMR